MMEENFSSILEELAETLSVKKLLSRFPSLTPEKLRHVLKTASRAVGAVEPAGENVWVIYVDGASRGNPGPAGAGALLIKDDEKIELTRYLGRTTNNVAEYEALILGLGEALDHGADRAEVRSDSELMVRQMTGAYKVKKAHLKPLYEKAMELAARFKKVNIIHIERGLNKEADRLANLAIDQDGDH